MLHTVTSLSVGPSVQGVCEAERVPSLPAMRTHHMPEAGGVPGRVTLLLVATRYLTLLR